MDDNLGDLTAMSAISVPPASDSDGSQVSHSVCQSGSPSARSDDDAAGASAGTDIEGETSDTESGFFNLSGINFS